MTLPFRLALAAVLLLPGAAARAAEPVLSRPLLVEVKEVPAADQQKGGRFDYSDYNRQALLSLVRNRALLLATAEEFAALQRDGYQATVVMESRDPLTLYRRAYYGPTLKLPEVYHTYDQINARADDLMRQCPRLITRIQIGETTQFHRPIYAYRISSDARHALPRPGVLYTGCHHSDEVMGAEIVTALMQDLVLGYGRDPAVTRWLDQCEVYVVPVVNVDGHDIVTSGRDPRWRKNARDVNGDGVTGVFPEGVDVNRGYDFNWAMGGSDVPAKDTYRGPYPFSEAENRAIRHLLELKSFVLSISYHSQGEVIYYPWSWNGQPAPDDALIREIADQMAAKLVTMDGNGHYAVSPGGASSQSYVWLYGRKGDFDFIVETGKGTHLFAPEDVPGIIATNLEGAKVLLDRAGGPGLAVHVTDAVTGRPLVAQVWLPRIENESVDRRTTEGGFGRYWRPLRPGQYDLIISCPGYQTAVRNGTEVKPGAWTPLEVALIPAK
ncbi:MAG: carboxypeptidase regulatory-like domain-containing protein [Verrucomicrobia bacterium]|nr:carboxypeptidase regulatory-like domain-containing protein [Verrucomicrobiota bacterium]